MNIGGIFRLRSTETNEEASDVSAPASSETPSGLTTFFSSPGKLIDSVNTKTGNFVSDLSSKLNNLKQVSVDKFENAVRGSGGAGSVSKEQAATHLYESERATGRKLTTPAPRAPHDNPFNVTCQQGGGEEAKPDWSAESASQRRSSTNLPRPPRPPPPTPVALSRAISLDEGNRKARQAVKIDAKPGKSLSTTLEQEDDAGRTGGLVEEDSSASEYGLDGDQPVYVTETYERFPSREEHNEQATTGDSREAKEMRAVVEKCLPALLSGKLSEYPGLHEKLSEILTSEVGRMSFVNALEKEAGCGNGQLESEAIPDLLKQIDVLLSECQDAEDFKPAKKLLTTSLLFQTVDLREPSQKVLLFERIKHFAIWQSLRFWNACFFQSVQEARVKSSEQDSANKSGEKIAYEQLQSYLRTMNIFNLHQSIMQEFLRKHGNLFNLTDDEIHSLQTSINSAG